VPTPPPPAFSSPCASLGHRRRWTQGSAAVGSRDRVGRPPLGSSVLCPCAAASPAPLSPSSRPLFAPDPAAAALLHLRSAPTAAEQERHDKQLGIK
jgi:hypothetical protein